MKIAAALTVLFSTIASSGASACRGPIDYAHLIKNITSKSVLLVDVVHAAYDRSGYGSISNHPWSGVVAVNRVMAGQSPVHHYEISRTGSSAACDDGVSVPRPGDKWVVYLGKSDDGRIGVFLTLPLARALSFDPTFIAAVYPSGISP